MVKFDLWISDLSGLREIYLLGAFYTLGPRDCRIGIESVDCRKDSRKEGEAEVKEREKGGKRRIGGYL